MSCELKTLLNSQLKGGHGGTAPTGTGAPPLQARGHRPYRHGGIAPTPDRLSTIDDRLSTVNCQLSTV
ncbi:MAG: hypothetical protein HC786_19510 [Richelia sp. CSU_2_1]|nr:hypothetical protein [Richelia sp. CSU_2_1]